MTDAVVGDCSVSVTVSAAAPTKVRTKILVVLEKLCGDLELDGMCRVRLCGKWSKTGEEIVELGKGW